MNRITSVNVKSLKYEQIGFKLNMLSVIVTFYLSVGHINLIIPKSK